MSCNADSIEPLPRDDQLTDMYRQDEYHDNFYADAAEEVSPSQWSDVQRFLVHGRRLLDFGCGNGAFLRSTRESGFEAVGVEPDPGTRKTAARNSGCRVTSLDELIARGEQFDIIRLGDVLEHLPAPAHTLRQIEPLLSDGGMFFVEGPLETNASLVRFCSNIFARLKHLAGKPTLAPSPPFHLSRTSARTQRRFFEQVMGYEVHWFVVHESGWPYLANERGPADLARVRTLRPLIGRAAITLARLGSAFDLQLGNRFAAVVAPVSVPGTSRRR